MTDQGKFCLIHRIGLRDNDANRLALLAKLKQITGFDYTFEVSPDWPEFVAMMHAADKDYKNHEQIGKIFFSKDGYLHHIVDKFEQACKDDMVKEALLEATPARKIKFTLRPVGQNAPVMAFTDGIFHVGVQASRVGHGSAKYICEGDITKFL